VDAAEHADGGFALGAPFVDGGCVGEGFDGVGGVACGFLGGGELEEEGGILGGHVVEEAKMADGLGVASPPCIDIGEEVVLHEEAIVVGVGIEEGEDEFARLGPIGAHLGGEFELVERLFLLATEAELLGEAFVFGGGAFEVAAELEEFGVVLADAGLAGVELEDAAGKVEGLFLVAAFLVGGEEPPEDGDGLEVGAGLFEGGGEKGFVLLGEGLCIPDGVEATDHLVVAPGRGGERGAGMEGLEVFVVASELGEGLGAGACRGEVVGFETKGAVEDFEGVVPLVHCLVVIGEEGVLDEGLVLFADGIEPVGVHALEELAAGDAGGDAIVGEDEFFRLGGGAEGAEVVGV
jgi:hypothetical protein